MAVNTITEATAAGAQYIDSILTGIYDCLTDATNLAVLKAGDDTVLASSIHVGTRAASPVFPSIYLAHLRTRQRDAELGGTRDTEGVYRIYAWHKSAEGEETLERDVAKLADRIAAVLHANRDRQSDGLWYDLIVDSILTGGSRGEQSLRGAQIDVRIRMRVTT